MRSEPTLLTERRGAIAIVTLNRPDKRNALSEALWHDLKNTFEGFGPDACAASFSPGPASIFAPASIYPEHRHREAARTVFSCRVLRTRRSRSYPVRRTSRRDCDAGRCDWRRPLEVATATHVRVADATPFYPTAGRLPRHICRRRRHPAIARIASARAAWSR